MTAVITDSTRPPSRLALINLLKAVAAQLIVLHHLAFYGPMADRARVLWPDLVDWLGNDARIAVQVFLVVGGFLAARSLSPDCHAGVTNPAAAIARRYAKLAPPFIAATLLAACASALAGHWMTHDSISPPATLDQLGAHVLLLHGVLGYDSVSAGAWYVAIDFQLYALFVLILWIAGIVAGRGRTTWVLPLGVALGVMFSLLHFNLDADWDVYAPYFFGSYGLGVLAWWAGDPRRKAGAVMLLVALALLPALGGLVLEFRSRIALALAVACLLFLCGRVRVTGAGRAWTAIDTLARISYAVFLVHFGVCLVVNALFTRFAPADAEWQALGVLVAWTASLAAGALFHRWVEVPLGRVTGLVLGGATARPAAREGKLVTVR